ncbi:serine/threonine-protein kinase [Glycomyces harbinensis]|uniref:serine/threonine-protein kinase n=1 Tax=Glycomyces harbinensis TaxID=58114 RepID=UPI000A3FD1B9|nr:serine/threonine-protein kinase [Glycomyces harbinensis]
MDLGTLVAGRYRLEDPIAAGGMGEVWRGFDTLLERPVAVKILRSTRHLPREARDRFAREAKTLASVRGPGLVEVYDYGEDTSGRRAVRFIVMELIEGTSLATLIAEHGVLSVEETLRYVAATAATLAVAHRSGIVHRDIKPGNLLVEPDGRLRVVDFGISLADGDDRLTSVGDVLGTLSYISPEQLGGGQVRGTADLYSLGAVAYECLTGRPPFTADDPHGVVYQHLHAQPPPLPDSLPPAVAALVQRCLQKHPEDRWPSASALAAACRAASTAADDTGVPTTRLRRRAGPRVFVTSLILVLAVGAVLMLWRPWSPARTDAQSGADTVAAESPSAPVSADAAPTASEAPSQEASTLPEATTAPAPAVALPDPGGSVETTAAAGVRLPDVVGMDATEAQAHLHSLGWTDVRIVPTLLFAGAAPEACEIVSQNPEPEAAVEHDHPVEIAYWGLHDCP